ncbi:STM4014 family protein, partial [Streptomyces bohaiensis]|uniref:STM4014 family protein n=1 Tax=Streptomyces bohaiensis TaxID=1431344 RepID=UPI0030C6E6D7
MIRTTVVGNPDNRRVALHAAAVRAAGLPAPRVLPWQEVLTTLHEQGAAALPGFAPDEIVRLDSPGEDPAVDALLRGAGDPTRVEGGARWYERFTSAARAVGARARADGARLLDDPEELAVLFDKRLCHGVLRGAGVPVPESPTSGPAAPRVRGWDDVRAAGLRRFFVKPAHGSSASGVIAVQWGPGGRIKAVTSVERDRDGGLFNSLRVRTLTAEAEIGELVDALAPDGLHLERWWPKASQGDRPVDLRVVVVAGRATHAVLRAGRSPMTNLHLGGVRGDLDAARRAAGPVWEEALAVCERAAAQFPGTLCVGVDLLPGVHWERVAVGEVNAFGDLLPRLTGLPGSGAEGLDTYGAQVSALLRGTGLRGPVAGS